MQGGGGGDVLGRAAARAGGALARGRSACDPARFATGREGRALGSRACPSQEPRAQHLAGWSARRLAGGQVDTGEPRREPRRAGCGGRWLAPQAARARSPFRKPCSVAATEPGRSVLLAEIKTETEAPAAMETEAPATEPAEASAGLEDKEEVSRRSARPPRCRAVGWAAAGVRLGCAIVETGSHRWP